MARRRPSNAKDSRRSTPRKLDKRDARIKKWDKPEDIPLDEEDQFHASRDKVLIDDEQEESDVDEDEVFALKGLPSDDSDEEVDDDDDVEEEEDEDDTLSSGKAPKTSKSSTKKTKSIPKPPESESGSDVDETEGWGSKKSAYYSSNAAQLESDDDEANEMEEQEARRLQAKMRAPLTESDFGLERLSLESSQRNETDLLLDDVHTYTPAAIPIQDEGSLIRHLEKTNPESLALAFEWDDIVQATLESEKKIAQSEVEGTGDAGLLHLYHDALLTYASLVAFYLHLRSNPKYASNPIALRNHPIMSRLLVLKKSISYLEDIQSASLEADDSEADSGDDFDIEEDLRHILDGFDGDLNELKTLLSQSKPPAPTTKKAPKTDNSKQTAEKKKKKDTSLSSIKYDLEEPDFRPSRPSAPQKDSISNSNAYGELTSLDAMDVEDKSSRRKSLQFHASKIESTSLRRQNARKAIGGDDDIPYRERQKEAAKKQKKSELGQGGDDLDESEPSPREVGHKRSRSSDDSGESDSDDDAGYYSLIKKQKNEKKQAKQAAYDAFREANRPDVEDEDIDGQRSVSRAILANKGLTPRRSKSVRNPRVKKRQRFEKAKKKIASQKAVYKGGIGDVHSYGGEQSGISKVVKSVKL